MSGHTLFDQAALKPFRFAGLEGKSAREEFIYIVDFATDVIKVGFTAQPQIRITTHMSTAAVYGVATVAVWVSAPHLNAKENERELIDHCLPRATARLSSEHFAGVNFADVVEYATSLPYQRGESAIPGKPKLFPLARVANEIGVPVALVQRMCRSQRLEHHYVGRRRLMDRAQIDAAVAVLIEAGMPAPTNVPIPTQ